jgi:DNA-binding XRE family transcriptional regulator
LLIIANVILDYIAISLYIKVMKRDQSDILPSLRRKIEQMGEQIALARLRRNLSVNLVAERAGISRTTLWAIERGSPNVAFGSYAKVLLALNLADDLLLVAKDDIVGKRMQDLNLPIRRRATKDI